MDARKKEFTSRHCDLTDNDHFANRREHPNRRDRMIGQVIAQDDVDVGGGPHRAILQRLPRAARIGYACAAPLEEASR